MRKAHIWTSPRRDILKTKGNLVDNSVLYSVYLKSKGQKVWIVEFLILYLVKVDFVVLSVKNRPNILKMHLLRPKLS